MQRLVNTCVSGCEYEAAFTIRTKSRHPVSVNLHKMCLIKFCWVSVNVFDISEVCVCVC